MADAEDVNNDELLAACARGDLEAVEEFLNRFGEGIENDSGRRALYEALFVASQQGNLSVVDRLLSMPGIQMNQVVTQDGMTPLYVASQEGHLQVVDRLLRTPNIDPNQATSNRERCSPLYTASDLCHVGIVERLLRAPGIRVNQTTGDGDTPLYVASIQGHASVVERLLQALDIDVNLCYTWTGATPLFEASCNGHALVVKLLLSMPGIQVNHAEAQRGMTPLFVACRFGHLPVVEQLLSMPDIQVNQGRTDNGLTPLHEASSSGDVSIAKLLLSMPDIQVNRTTTARLQSRTPLWAASTKAAAIQLIWHGSKCEDTSIVRDIGLEMVQVEYPACRTFCLACKQSTTRLLGRLYEGWARTYILSYLIPDCSSKIEWSGFFKYIENANAGNEEKKQ